MSGRINPFQRTPITPASYPSQSWPVAYVIEVLVKCKLDGEVMPITKALEHQKMHEQKGEQACFTIEGISTSRPKIEKNIIEFI